MFLSRLCVNVRDFGATGDGVNDDTVAFRMAYAMKDARGGGIVVIPVGRYLLTGAIDVGTQPCITLGVGWSIKSGDLAFGSATWTAIGGIVGSVLLCTGSGSLTCSTDYSDGHSFENFAIVGPGTGNTSGLVWTDAGPHASSRLRLSNLLVGNFATGVALGNVEDVILEHLCVYGNTTGLLVSRATEPGGYAYCDDVRVYNLNCVGNTTGVLITGIQGLRFCGGLVQSNSGVGISIAPELNHADLLGNAESISIEGFWFENNPSGGILIDTTHGNVKSVVIDKSHFDQDFLNFAGTNTIAGLYLGKGIDIIGAGSTIVIPSSVKGGSSEMQTNSLGLTNKSQAFTLPDDVACDLDFSTVTEGLQIAAEIAIPDNSVTEFEVDVIAVNGTNAASWRSLRATYVRSFGGIAVPVGTELSAVPPTVSTAGTAALWSIAVQKTDAPIGTLIVQVDGVTNANVDWRIRVRGRSRS